MKPVAFKLPGQLTKVTAVLPCQYPTARCSLDFEQLFFRRYLLELWRKISQEQIHFPSRNGKGEVMTPRLPVYANSHRNEGGKKNDEYSSDSCWTHAIAAADMVMCGKGQREGEEGFPQPRRAGEHGIQTTAQPALLSLAVVWSLLCRVRAGAGAFGGSAVAPRPQTFRKRTKRKRVSERFQLKRFHGGLRRGRTQDDEGGGVLVALTSTRWRRRRSRGGVPHARGVGAARERRRRRPHREQF